MKDIPKCPKCGNLGTYNAPLDAYMCGTCAAWIQDTCANPDCESCRVAMQESTFDIFVMIGAPSSNAASNKIINQALTEY